MKFYKPNDKNTGSAFQLNIGKKKRNADPVIFIEATKQAGPKPAPGSKTSPFNWKNKIVLMINSLEASTLNLYIKNPTPNGVSLIHQTEKAGTKTISSLTLKAPVTEEEKKYGNWFISVKRDSEMVAGRLAPNEINLINILLEQLMIREANATYKNTKTSPFGEDSDEGS